jgi:hypothetical protein
MLPKNDLLTHTILIDELAGPDAPVVERLLARRAALCWHAVHWYEYDYINRESQSVALTYGVYLQKRIDGANGRLLQSLKTLELVRRLARPGAGVNVSVSQQVTVEAAQAPTPEESRMTVADLMNAAPRG